MTEIVNARISTKVSAADVLAALATEFSRTKATLEQSETTLKIVNPKYKSLFDPPANTTVNVELTKSDDGWLLTGSIDQKNKPSRILLPLGCLAMGLVWDRWYMTVLGVVGLIVTVV